MWYIQTKVLCEEQWVTLLEINPAGRLICGSLTRHLCQHRGTPKTEGDIPPNGPRERVGCGAEEETKPREQEPGPDQQRGVERPAIIQPSGSTTSPSHTTTQAYEKEYCISPVFCAGPACSVPIPFVGITAWTNLVVVFCQWSWVRIFPRDTKGGTTNSIPIMAVEKLWTNIYGWADWVLKRSFSPPVLGPIQPGRWAPPWCFVWRYSPVFTTQGLHPSPLALGSV